jgi:hypothetical protein
MSVIIEDFMCYGCSLSGCNGHEKETIVVDKKTGLQIKVICICPNHLTKDENLFPFYPQVKRSVED